jgi:hypothetical protein
MVWMTVRIEPEPVGARVAALPSYILCIPVLPDGRLAFRQLLAAPDRARVWYCASSGERRSGQLRLVDYQWTCSWETGPGLVPLPDLRLIGGSFAPDDIVGVRPRNGTLAVYRVNGRVALTPEPAGLR